MNKILQMDLSPEDEKIIRESLSEWKEGVYSQLLEEVEEVKSAKIEELEEANIQYQEELKEEYTDKMLEAIEEMREEIKKEVLVETYENNPELKILEEIKSLVAPSLNESYLENTYSDQIQALIEENNELKEKIKLEEGAETLAELLKDHSKTTQNIILSMIKEGGPEEVTEQYYELIESLKSLEEEEEDFEEDEDEDEEFDFDDDDEEEDDEEDDDDEFDEDFDSYIEDEDEEVNEEEEEEEEKKTNPFLDEMKNLSK